MSSLTFLSFTIDNECMVTHNERGIAHLVIIVLVVLGIIVGITAVKNPTFFNPQAAVNSTNNACTSDTQCQSGYYCERCPAGDNCAPMGVCKLATATPLPTQPPTGTNDLKNGLISYWNLDDAGTTASDSMNANNGTITGTSIVDGKFGKARNFKTNTGHSVVDLGNSASLNPTNGITVSAWINELNGASDPNIIHRTQTWALFRDSSDAYWEISPNIAFSIRDPQNTYRPCRGTTVLANNTWYHVVATYDLQNINLYVNGVLDKSCPMNVAMRSTNNNTYIARYADEGGNQVASFPGFIDEVGIWNRALSEAEIKLLANGTIPTTVVTPTPQPSTPTASTDPVVALVTLPKVAKKDQALTFAWNFVAGATGKERVNVYRADGFPTGSAPLTSVYLNCTGQVPATPIPTGSCSIDNILSGQPADKKYILKMYAQDGRTIIASSNEIQLSD